MAKRVLAVDLGASSGRGIVFAYDGNSLTQTEVFRFANGAKEEDGRLVWDASALFSGTVECIARANRLCGKLDGVGIDTWGVDYGMIDMNGNLAGNPRHYRDPANAETRTACSASDEHLYKIAGISINDFNTTYQLMARVKEGQDWSNIRHILFMPQLIGYLLTGEAATEETVASTSGFYRRDSGFDEEFLKRNNIPSRLFPPVRKGLLGYVKKEVAASAGIDYALPVWLSAGHDTACAVFALPTEEEHPLYLSSGTWSLIGTLNSEPVIDRRAYSEEYTNELAFGTGVRFLRNIMGMWIIQECRRIWLESGEDKDYRQIALLAENSPDSGARIDVNDRDFARPCDMPAKIAAYVRERQGIVLSTCGETARCVYESLADAYRDALNDLQEITGRKYGCLHIIGGGSNNNFLNALTAKRLGIDVYAGPAEASALGNAAGQLILSGEDPESVRRAVMRFCDTEKFGC